MLSGLLMAEIAVPKSISPTIFPLLSATQPTVSPASDNLLKASSKGVVSSRRGPLSVFDGTIIDRTSRTRLLFTSFIKSEI